MTYFRHPDHCKYGHPYNEQNTAYVVRDGQRVRRCRTCTREQVQRWRDRQRARKVQP